MNLRNRVVSKKQFVLGAALSVALALSIGTPAQRLNAQPVSAQLISAQSIPSGASVLTKVQVPQSMRSGAFQTDQSLLIPPGFAIAVYARIDDARFMAVAPNGDLLVSQPSNGKVSIVRANPNGDPQVSDFVTGLSNPHDIVFHTIDATTYVYISESNQINRFVYKAGDLTAHDRQIVVKNLPDPNNLHTGYAHPLKNIALDSNHKLYVQIGSTCNACIEDTQSEPLRGAIYQYDADGSNGRLFARGLRNAEGLAIVPGTNTLWVAVNNRDNTPYPLDDGSGNYGKVFPSYVDNHPPDEFIQVRDGGNYGWPFCNPNPDTPVGLNTMPFDRDYDLNSSGTVNCDTMDKVTKGIQAHSAALGLTFLQSTKFADAYRNGAVIALHGSWNRTAKAGYKVIYYPWNSTAQMPGAQVDLITGWLDNNNYNWGRPVDTVVDLQGNLLISDDSSGAVYKLSTTN